METRIAELRYKEVISVEDGSRFGYVGDMEIDLDSGQVRALVEARVRRLNLKSKSVAPGQIELNYEVRLRDADTEFVNELGAMEGVGNVVLVSYNGDYMG